jgi:hypothetical protein
VAGPGTVARDADAGGDAVIEEANGPVWARLKTLQPAWQWLQVPFGA